MLLAVMLRSLVPMLFGMSEMRVGHVRMMRGPEVIARFMMLCSFGMVVRSHTVMMSGLLMMMNCLFGHWGDLHFRSQT